MASHRLLEALDQFAPEEAERVFGDEYALRPPDSTVTLAPVRRVAIFAEAFLPKVDGVSKTAFLTLRYLQQTGREVIVFAPDIAPPAIGDTQVVALHSFALPIAPETRIALPHPVIAQHIEQFQPDVIHLFSPFLLSMHGVIVGRQRGIPVIANYQTDLPGYAESYGFNVLTPVAREYLRILHNNCHYTLVPSNYTMRQLHGWGFHRLRRWGRGVHNARFNPSRRTPEMRARLLNGRDPNSLLCIYVGRLAPEKRLDLLRDVAKTPGVALTIIGDGALRDELETMFAGTDTHFTGYMFGDELAAAYASADAFFFAGTQETFGQVVQEALASGLPSVIINQGGITDLVEHGTTGFICPDDPRAFASAARLLRDDVALRRRMSYNARRTVEQNSWEAIMAQLEGHYNAAARLNRRFQRAYPPAHGLLDAIRHWGR